MLYFTADEHFGHNNIIKYCNRPFSSVRAMDYFLVEMHNEVVTDKDTVIHVGDFTLIKDFDRIMDNYISKLNGKYHIFVKGSHDYWMNSDLCELTDWGYTRYSKYIDAGSMYEFKCLKFHVTACHYAMRVWPRAHYNSWQIYGHSHGNLPPVGKQWDVGVDNNDFRPVSEVQLKDIMDNQPDNFNLVNKRHV